MSILVSGSLAYDHIMNFPDSFKNHIMPENIHILNVCFVVNDLKRTWGGTAGNVAYTMRLFGSDPLIVSAVGSDGGDYIKYLSDQGIATKYIYQDASQLTASAFITTDADDNQITAFHTGPLALATRIDVRAMQEAFSLALICPSQKDVIMKHLADCSSRGIKTVFDPGQQITVFNGQELRAMIQQSHFLIGNDYEMKMMQERTGWSATETLKATKVLITTLGAQGSVIATSEGETIAVASCPPASTDDPTGAGDAYRAGFFIAYEQGFDLKTCGQVGSVAASYAIETYGTQAHNFTHKDFCKRYEKVYGEKLILK